MNYEIVSRASCPYCVAAIRLLEERGMRYNLISVDDQPKLLNEYKSKLNWGTVPMVFEIDKGHKKFIGGYTDLKEYLDRGKTLLRGQPMSKKAYGLKVTTVISTVDYLIEVRDLCETYVMAYDSIEQLENIREFRLMCAMITSITEQIEWIMDLVDSTPPDKDNIIPLTDDTMKDLKFFSERTNEIFEELKYDFNISFTKH